jgi:hypothetical protein
MKNQKLVQNKKPKEIIDSAMFSLCESESHYLVALDIPTIPSVHTEIAVCKGQLRVESQSEKTHEKQTIFKMRPNGSGIETVYMDGILYLLLPKLAVNFPSEYRGIA